MSDFISNAIRTKSPRFYTERVDARIFFNVMQLCIDWANKLDAIKKAFFYGKELPLALRSKEVGELSVNWHYPDGTPVPREVAIDIIHCALGKFTEAGEMLENLLGVMVHGKTFDKVNFAEEMFDGQWYDAVGCNAIGITFEEGQGKIIAKLMERFPLAFSDEQAINRDHAKERVVLENASLPTGYAERLVAGPENDKVICPNCATQFRAIPVDVQNMLRSAGFVPPFVMNEVNGTVDKGEADN